jgi:sulfatase modifying factor 1
MTFKNLGILLFAGTAAIACSSTNNQTDESEPQVVTIGPVNEAFVKALNFPETIMYLGLEKPVDTSVVSFTGDIPDGMIGINGGVVRVGSEEGFDHERPMFWAKVKPFLMDKSPVTVAEFRKFVNATDFKTQAENFGDGGMIGKSTNNTWILKPGANWEYPMGKDFPKAANNHPVTQVSWNDAAAYANWADKRLPNEIEWEHAARNAQNSRTIYSWGNDIKTEEGYNANVWQGTFPNTYINEDGYPQTSPVGEFGNTPLGLTDMSGNVWEWCSNTKFSYEALFRSVTYPTDTIAEKAERGGSFLCEPSWCHGYRVAGRSNSSVETSLFHVGFRCVKDVE